MRFRRQSRIGARRPFSPFGAGQCLVVSQILNFPSGSAQARSSSPSIPSRKSSTESPPRVRPIVRCSLSHIHVHICVYVCDARFASFKREEYRTPSIVIVSLARVRLEPPPHLAFGLAGTSPPDRFYTFVSPTLVDVRARSCARSLVRSYRGTSILHTGSSTTAERIDLFFLPSQTYVGGRDHASRLVHARRYYLWVL